MDLLDGVISKITNPYERKARQYPALLAFLPLLTMFTLLYSSKSSAATSAASIAVACGGLYLMSNLCRELGKSLEGELFREWGGKPTTQLLRHRDDVIEAPTKVRYHSFLAARINESFPDKLLEKESPDLADGLYQSGVRWLLSNTRPDDNKKFDLLFKENITYGFRRNALGVKKIGMAISIGCILWTLFKERVVGLTRPFIDFSVFVRMPDASMASLAVSGVMLLVWMLFVTKATVRTTAFTYAEMLLQTCDTIGTEKRP